MKTPSDAGSPLAWSRIGKHSWLAGIALLLVAVAVQQTYSSAARRPVRATFAPREVPADHPDAFALAKLHLLARQPAEAARYFHRLWKAGDNRVPNEVVAAYLGLCAEIQGHHAEAREWYQKAGDRDGYHGLVLARMPRVDRVAALAFAADEPEPDKVRAQILDKMKKAEDRARKEGSAEARVLLLSWRFLYAELGVVGDKAVPGLALDQFTKALKELQDLEADVAGKPDVKKAIEDDPKLQNRLNDVRARLADSTKKFATARDIERRRLNDLRALVRHYRGTDKEPGLVVDLTKATTALLLDDRAAAGTSLEAAGKQIDAITKLVADARDAHLFEDENEQVVPGEVGPFSKRFLAHLGMMRGYLKYKEAIESPDDPASARRLADAAALATAALATEKDNPLGLYVLGLVAEAQGVALTRPNPADEEAQKTARPLFREAEERLTAADKALPTGDESKPLRRRIARRIARLNSADGYLDEAKTLTASGGIDEAYALLGEGERRHRDPRLWNARAEAARRAHLQGRVKVAQATLEEMTTARDAKLFGARDSKAWLAEGKLQLVLADADILRLDQLDAAEKKNLADRIDVSSRLLRKALDSAPRDRIERAKCAGALALALAYQQILTPSKDPRRDPEVREAFTLASDAVKEIGGLARLEVEDREALATAQLARGHLSVQILPAYRDEALRAFNRAVAESAALPYPTKGLGSLGAPLMSELARRPENASVKQVEDLTRQRRVMAGFVDGVMVLTQNQPSAAVRKMEQALAFLKKPIKVDDPLEEIDLEDRLVAYIALGQVEAGKPGEAVLTVVRTLDENLDEPQALRQSATLAGQLPSPLLTYALAVALEKRAEAFGLGDQPLRAPTLAGARAAYARAARMLDSPAARESVPGYRLESVQGVARLASPKEYLDRWRTLREDNRLLQAEQTAREGLARHPASAELWRAYLDTRLARLTAAGAKDKEDWQDLLDDLDALSAQANGLRFERAFWEGLVRQQLKEYDRASTLFETARKLAVTPEDKVRAQSRLVESQLEKAPTR